MARPATAMKMKTIINSSLLIACVWTRLQLLVADDAISHPIWDFCQNTKYRIGSDFKRNLNQVLESLVGNASTSRFNTRVEGQNTSSTVYGFFQCRGDLNSSDCENCASTANAMLLNECNRTSGFVQLDDCFLRYDTHNFFNVYDNSEFQIWCNDINPGNQLEQFENKIEEELSKILEKAVKRPELFATDKNVVGRADVQKIYTLALCWGNLSQTNCRSCLDAGRSNISGSNISYASTICKPGSVGARYISTNCVLRYEVYSFFNSSIILPPPPPRPLEIPRVSGNKRYKVLVITLSAVAASLGLIAAICLGTWNLFSRRKRGERISGTRGEREIKLSLGIANQELIFKYNILREATSNFKEENKLGEGGFGSVFKGVLPDGREVAIKRLNIGSRQGDAEFLNEANLISNVQHKNLVKLIGYSVENSERLLVYEYLQNSSLDKILFDTTKRHLLDWRDRYEIIVGTARGLAYILHEESEIRIVHRDIKASNILLDGKYKPKIADFGLAKLFGEDQSHISTRVAGTL